MCRRDRRYSLGLRQPLHYTLLTLRTASPQPRLELLLTRRCHEDVPRLDAALLHLLDALHLDIQHHHFPLGGLVTDGLFARAVAVPAELGVLDEAVLGDQVLELGVRHKVVVHGVLLARAGLARRVADGEGEGVRVALAEEVEECALSDA